MQKKTKTSVAHQKFIVVLGLVPRGTVASYGQIARLAGYAGGARQVVWTLHSSSKKHRLPWHRIINAQGKIGHFDERSQLRQKLLLMREGIEFDSGDKVDFKKFGWRPEVAVIKKRLRQINTK